MKHYNRFVLLFAVLFLLFFPYVVEADTSYIEPKFTENVDGPIIGTTVKDVISKDGKFYRDSNGNGELDAFENWELDVDERVSDLVSRMTVDQKLGLLVISDRKPGIYTESADNTSMEGLLDETSGESRTMFGVTTVYGTTEAIGELNLRRFILRQNPKPNEIAKWNNAMQQVAESTDNGVPVVIVSNSRNENGEMTFGMNDALGVFSTWPGTLGLAAAAMGDIKNGGDAQLITDFAEISRSEWDASGIKKGYMYMADVVTDPRWQRGYGTLGERPDFVSDAIGRLVRGFQGSSEELQPNGVALTVKHFPGGGARENGFDPHYSLGQWNVYATENSLEKYHLPPFKAAIDNNVSAIMPYYAKPYEAKSASQEYDGMELDLSEAVGFAYNKFFITELLRGKLGHKGYVNSDTGILGNMAWGMQDKDEATQAAYALNAGTDVISGPTNTDALKGAYEKGLLSEDRINEAAGRLLKEEFLLGLFENPYRNIESADEAVEIARADSRVYQAHQKSVVLLKNIAKTLPLTTEKLSGKKVFVKFFNSTGETDEATAALQTNLTERGMTVTEDYNEADYAIFFIHPASGQYFSATAGYLELDICDGKTVVDVDTETGVPVDTTHEETTLKGTAEIAEIANVVHNNGGLVIANVNVTLPWMMGNVEPYVDALTVGFDTFTDAIIDVMIGVYTPTGVLPLTLPKDDDVISVDKNGDCISPNDVPGYDKDQYMPEELLDENKKGYAYRDSVGSYYESSFGLTFESDEPSDGPGGGQSSSDIKEILRELLGLDSSVTFQDVSDSMKGSSNSVSSLTSAQKSKISNSHTAKLALETFTLPSAGVYMFDISRSTLLNSGLKEGDKIFLYMLSAGDSVSSAVSTGDYRFFNSNDEIIDKVPATGDVSAAVYVGESGSYVPVIATEASSSSGFLGSSSSGCDTGLSVAGLLLLCGLFSKFKKNC